MLLVVAAEGDEGGSREGEVDMFLPLLPSPLTSYFMEHGVITHGGWRMKMKPVRKRII